MIFGCPFGQQKKQKGPIPRHRSAPTFREFPVGKRLEDSWDPKNWPGGH